MGNVFRSARAVYDLFDIWSFIAQDNFDAADRFMDRLDSACNSLSASPEMGRSRAKELGIPGLRSFPVGNYIIWYCPNEEDSLTIVRVLNAARDIENLLDE